MLWVGLFEVSILAGARDFSHLKNIQAGSGAYMPCVQGVLAALFAGVEWPGHEADHLPQSSAEVKNEWSCTSPAFVCHHGICRNIFAFMFLQARIVLC
jgi:hypothetical protein